MIILDTNIISEMMKPTPNVKVLGWIDSQEVRQLFISTITIAEINYRLNTLPEGNRRKTLENAFSKAILASFTGRILSFDEASANHYGKMMAHRKQLGYPMGVPDGQIAAIARSRNASIATRNVKDFRECEVQLINPFAD